MQSKVYETAGRLSVCPSVCPIVGGFAAGVITGRRYRQTGGGAGTARQLQARSAATAPQHGAQQQMRRECPVDSAGTTLNTDSLHYYYYYYYAAFNAPCVGHKDDESQALAFPSHFYRAMLCILCPSVCLSVCLSQVGVLLKRLNEGLRKQHQTITQGL